jgi:hypothetical protein
MFVGPLQSHMGYAFEQCARQYMWRILKAQSSPVSFQKIGRWWGTNPKERREEEIDFIAFSKETALFGECKWRGEHVGEDVLAELTCKSELFPQFRRKEYALFSKGGFSQALRRVNDKGYPRQRHLPLQPQPRRSKNKRSPIPAHFRQKLIMNGGDIFRLQKILGHSTLDMVKNYMAIYGGDLKRDYDRYSLLDQARASSEPQTGQRIEMRK